MSTISFVSILNIYFWNLLYFTDLWHNAATCAHCWQDQYGQNLYPKRTGWTAWHASFWWPSYCNVQQPKCRSCSNTWSVEIFESNFYWIYGSKNYLHKFSSVSSAAKQCHLFKITLMASVTIENCANFLKTISTPQIVVPSTALNNWSSYLLILLSVYKLTYLHLFSNLFRVSICHFLPALPTPQCTSVHFSFTYLSNILSL